MTRSSNEHSLLLETWAWVACGSYRELPRNADRLPNICAQQCVAEGVGLCHHFSCGLRDADYVGYTARHLHQRIAAHKYSVISRHFVEAHGSNHLLEENQFRVLRKCQGKFDCLVFEMLYIKNLKSNLNIPRRTPYLPDSFFNYFCSFLTVKVSIIHCYFDIFHGFLAILKYF